MRKKNRKAGVTFCPATTLIYNVGINTEKKLWDMIHPYI